MSLTVQTESDLKSILETLDQRLHEITSGCVGGAAIDPAMTSEAAALQGLRESASAMLLQG